MRRAVFGLILAAGLAGAQSAQAQAAYVVSGGFSGLNALPRVAALQNNQQTTIQTHQTTLADLESRLTALESGGGGGAVQQFWDTTPPYTCPAGYTIGLCLGAGGTLTQGTITGGNQCAPGAGSAWAIGFCYK